MTKLLLRNDALALNYGLPTQDTDTDAIIQEYTARGWSVEDVMRHIDAAVEAGAFTRDERKMTKRAAESAGE